MTGLLRFDDLWREEVDLADGRRVRLRKLQPEDKERLATGMEHLSPSTRIARFHSKKDHLSDEELRYLTEFDGVDHFAIGVTELVGSDEGPGLGVGRFVCIPGRPGTAEAAIVVADGCQGQGLGKLILRRLVAAAVERGVQRFACDVLVDNEPMQALLRSLAPDAEAHVEDGVMQVEWLLSSVTPDDQQPRSPLERLLALAAEGLVVVRSWIGLPSR